MKKQVLILLSVIFLNHSFGQNKIEVYMPNGTNYKGTAKTINELNKEFENYSRVYTFDSDIRGANGTSIVGFKLFTNQPLWILTDDKSTIEQAINSFRIGDFLVSYKCEMEIEKFIEKGTLSDIFILETLGQPDKKAKYFDKDIQIDLWTFINIGITFSFKNGIVTSYTKIE